MRWMLVLGFYGVMVGSASAANWPKHVCEELIRVEQSTTASNGNKLYRAFARSSLLTLERERCGVDVSAKEAEDDAAAKAFDKRQTVVPRAPVLCDTTRKANGGSTTDCF